MYRPTIQCTSVPSLAAWLIVSSALIALSVREGLTVEPPTPLSVESEMAPQAVLLEGTPIRIGDVVGQIEGTHIMWDDAWLQPEAELPGHVIELSIREPPAAASLPQAVSADPSPPVAQGTASPVRPSTAGQGGAEIEEVTRALLAAHRQRRTYAEHVRECAALRSRLIELTRQEQSQSAQRRNANRSPQEALAPPREGDTASEGGTAEPASPLAKPEPDAPKSAVALAVVDAEVVIERNDDRSDASTHKRDREQLEATLRELARRLEQVEARSRRLAFRAEVHGDWQRRLAQSEVRVAAMERRLRAIEARHEHVRGSGPRPDAAVRHADTDDATARLQQSYDDLENDIRKTRHEYRRLIEELRQDSKDN